MIKLYNMCRRILAFILLVSFFLVILFIRFFSPSLSSSFLLYFFLAFGLLARICAVSSQSNLNTTIIRPFACA